MPFVLTYPPALLRPEDAAEYLGISARTLARFEARSDLVAVDIQGMKRFRRTDLDELAARLDDWDGDHRRPGN